MRYTSYQSIAKILKIALPSSGNSLLDIINASLGLYFISRISSQAHIATQNIVAFNLGLSCYMFIFALTNIFYIGTNAQISRAFGEKNHTKISLILTTMALCAFVCSLPVCALAHLGNGLFFDLMNVDEETKLLGMQYLGFVFYGIPAMLLRTIFVSSLAGVGDTKTVFFVKIFATLLDILLHFILIFGLYAPFGLSFSIAPLGIVGAGIANLITISVESFILFILLCKCHSYLRFMAGFSLAFFTNAMRIGIPTGIERFLTITSLVLITKFMTEYGLNVVAGFQIGSRVESYIFMPGFGFQVAAMVLVGQMLGARRIDLAESFVKFILRIATVIMGILGILLCVFGTNLSSLFSADATVINYSFGYILAVGLSQVPLIWIFVFDGALRAAGATKISLLVSIISIWGLRIVPMWLCVSYGVNVWFIFGIICIETYIRAAIFGYIFYKGLWKRFIVRL